MRDPRVASDHLSRDAYLYVRQSTLRQISENGESTRRQYALRERALALGWPAERIHVIDQDLGMSGAHSEGRDGFQQLVAAVGLRKVGIVLGLEVSRLARNSVDWQQLLQLCAYTNTLILDEEGIYDPSAFNDRLLLGLKGTMSEAELHLLGSRLRGGILNKARRGELALRLPVGLVHLADGRCARDCDAGIQASIAAVFEAFAATGTIAGTLRQLVASGIRFPQVAWGRDPGTIIWCDYNRTRVCNILTNPAYAGAYVYGRRRCRRAPDGHMDRCKLGPQAWTVVIPDHFAGYVSWTEFQTIQAQLLRNAQPFGRPSPFGPPREGPALLQGRVMCGRCGSPMYVRYNGDRRRMRARYVCIDHADARRAACQSVPAIDIDAATAQLILDLMTPMAIEMTLAIQSELDRRLAESEQHHQLRITRARYESDTARRRFMLVDPANRLVAAGLEAEWNAHLSELAAAEDELVRFRSEIKDRLSDDMRCRIMSLADDLSRLWADPAVIDRERKEILALLIEDVTILEEHSQITAHVRLRGGACRSLNMTRSRIVPSKQTLPDVVTRIDQLLELGDDSAVAEHLNAAGIRNWRNSLFTRGQIANVRKGHDLRSHRERRNAGGYLTAGELAARYSVTRTTIRHWAQNGLLERFSCGNRHRWYYRLPVGTEVVKGYGGPHAKPPRIVPICNSSEHGVV
ncbi:MAG TPA: recombinase family protein [Steroidobacteraceae bacterium]|nr:recombinase family protein [Steroidobacteraceae bacterium]